MLCYVAISMGTLPSDSLRSVPTFGRGRCDCGESGVGCCRVGSLLSASTYGDWPYVKDPQLVSGPVSVRRIVPFELDVASGCVSASVVWRA